MLTPDLADPRGLVGRWQMRRSIEDRRGPQSGLLDGVLELAEEDGRLRWQERLVWHRADGDVEMSRALWVVPQGDGWLVRFDDGAPFHRWSPGEQVVHDCAPDTYRGTVSGTAEGWRVVWEVSGPAKDYTMVTDLAR